MEDLLAKRHASQFPLMVVTSIVYPCNFGCPNCPYTDENSDLRLFYRENKADRISRYIWDKIADECGRHGAYIRCTGGGEPMLHPDLPDMIRSAKLKGAKIWINTNGSMFGPDDLGKSRLHSIIDSGVEMIEFSMDAADHLTYNKLRPPVTGKDPRSSEQRWEDQVNNVREALRYRDNTGKFETKIVVSMIRQKELFDIESAKKYWKDVVKVDNVITRKFLTWDNNTNLTFDHSLDDIYNKQSHPGFDVSDISPCVWLFERLNIDTLGRFALCGQDIGFSTANLFPTIEDTTIEEVWNSDVFTQYREAHINGHAESISPCNNCSAWKAGVRDWDYGWLKVLRDANPQVTLSQTPT
jgi:MoaA/NifB/PqqE/SkfB family radical SAM enzyme